MGLLMQCASCYMLRDEQKMEEDGNIITFFCFSGANCNGVGNSEMVYIIEQ